MSDSDESQKRFLPLSGPGEPTSESPVIEGYEIIRELGAGGMGLVYLADQKRPIKRLVAVKVIKPGMDSQQVISRFEVERQALAMMEHPNIAHIFDAGTTTDGRPFFVMEYVAGKPITVYCDERRLNIEDRLKLFLQVCEAVQYAHQKGIIHRDIKPSNILITDIEGKPLPKIIDFGVAKAIHQPLTERTLFTEQGQLVGTPEYMSPEQTGITQQDVDTRSDIYSLGILLYELLTGRLPFDRQALELAAYIELLRIIREQDPPRPSALVSTLGEEAKTIAEKRSTQVTALVRRLHSELEWIPLKAMRKEPNHRYRTAADLADDIQNYLNGKPLIAGPESRIYRIKKFTRRHRAAVVGTAIVLTVLISGAVVSTLFAIGQARALKDAEEARIEESKARSEAEDAREVARQQQKTAEQEAKYAREEAEAHRRTSYLNMIRLADNAYHSGDIKHMQNLLLDCPSDLRQWEWYYLWNSMDQAKVTIQAHGGDVKSVSFSNDGRLLTSYGRKKIAYRSSDSEEVKLWNAETGDKAIFGADVNSTGIMKINPRGDRVVFENSHGDLVLWDTEAQANLATFKKYNASSTYINFSKSGNLLIIYEDKMVRLVNAQTGILLEAFGEDELADVRLAELSPKGSYVALWTDDGMVTLYDSASGNKVMTIDNEKEWVDSVTFSVNEKYVICDIIDDPKKVYDIESGKELRITIPFETIFEGNPIESADLKYLVIHNYEGGSSLWDTESAQILMVFPDDVEPIEFSTSSRYIVTTSADGTNALYEVTSGNKLMEFGGTHLIFGPDDRQIATADASHIELWDIESRTKINEVNGCKPKPETIAFSPDGLQLAWWQADDEKIYLWKPDNGDDEPMAIFDEQREIHKIHFHPDGKRLILICVNKVIKICDTEFPADVLVLKSPFDLGYNYPIRFSPSKNYLIIGNKGDYIALWNLDSGTGENFLPLGKRCSPLAVDPKGETVVLSDGNIIRLWHLESNKESMVLIGHEEPVVIAKYSPDGKRLATQSEIGTTILWDSDSGKMIRILEHGMGREHPVAFSNNSNQIAVGYQDGNIRIFNAGSGTLKTVLTGYQNVQGMVFVGNDQNIISVDGDSLRLWHIESGQQLMSFKDNDIDLCTFRSDGKYLITVGSDLLRIWDTRFLKPVFECEYNIFGTRPFFCDERLVLVQEVSKSDCEVSIIELDSGKEVAKLYDRGVSSASCSQSGKHVAVGYNDGRIKLFETSSGRELMVLNGHKSYIESLAFSADGKEIVSGDRSGVVKTWDILVNRLNLDRGNIRPKITSYDPVGNRILAGYYNGTVRLWDLNASEMLLNIQAHENTIRSMAFSSDGRRFVTGSDDDANYSYQHRGGIIKLWDTDSGKQLKVFSGHETGVLSLAFSPDGNSIVSGCEGGRSREDEALEEVLKSFAKIFGSKKTGQDLNRVPEVAVWDIESESKFMSLKGHSRDVHFVTFNHNGKQILSASVDGTNRVWDVDTSMESAVLGNRGAGFASVDFSQSGDYALCTCGNALELWDTGSGKLLETLQGHKSKVCSATFSPDGKRIVSGDQDGVVKLWDAESYKEVITLQSGGEAIRHVAFNSDGTCVVAITDSEAKIYRAADPRKAH